MQLDHERQHEADVRAGEDVGPLRARSGALVHIDDAHPVVAFAVGLGPADDGVELVEQCGSTLIAT